jgi:hypothetical protein
MPTPLNRPGTPGAAGRRVRQAGVSLIDALVALSVLMLAVVALMRWQSGVAVAAESWRERSVAALQVRQALESRGVPRGAVRVARATPAGVTVLSAGTGVLSTVEATRRWTDRHGDAQAFSLALQWPVPDLDAVDFHDAGLQAPAAGVRGAGHRHPGVPREAVDLDPRTAWAPAGVAGLAGWAIDRETGAVLGACRSAPPAPAVAAVTGSARLPEGCEPLPGRLLAGVIRFASGATPSAHGPYVDPLPLTLVLPLAPGVTAWPGCETRAVSGADAHLAWRCFVPAPSTLADGASPEPRLQPDGWSLDAPGATHRLCRYVGSFAETGFGPRHQLVVEAAADCPAGTTPAAQSAG